MKAIDMLNRLPWGKAVVDALEEYASDHRTRPTSARAALVLLREEEVEVLSTATARDNGRENAKLFLDGHEVGCMWAASGIASHNREKYDAGLRAVDLLEGPVAVIPLPDEGESGHLDMEAYERAKSLALKLIEEGRKRRDESEGEHG